jgi:hypothetical protein
MGLAAAVSSASAATVGVVYTNILQPRHVEVAASVGVSGSNVAVVKNAVVLNASDSILGTFADSSADSDAPACPSAERLRGCMVVARASNLRVNILGYAVTIPPIWLGGDSQDAYSNQVNRDFWPSNGGLPDFEIVVRGPRPQGVANGSSPNPATPGGTQAQSGSQSQGGSQQQTTGSTNSIATPTASSNLGGLVELELVAPQTLVVPQSLLVSLSTVADPIVASIPGPLISPSPAFAPFEASPNSQPSVDNPGGDLGPQTVASFPPGPPPPPSWTDPAPGPSGARAPEPSTWAMLIAGIATLGLFKRRRIAAAFRSATG